MILKETKSLQCHCAKISVLHPSLLHKSFRFWQFKCKSPAIYNRLLKAFGLDSDVSWYTYYWVLLLAHMKHFTCISLLVYFKAFCSISSIINNLQHWILSSSILSSRFNPWQDPNTFWSHLNIGSFNYIYIHFLAFQLGKYLFTLFFLIWIKVFISTSLSSLAPSFCCNFFDLYDSYNHL